MKQQTNLWIEVEVWRAYRELCRGEKLRSSVPLEEFLKVVVENGSPSGVLNMMRAFRKTRAEGFEAYVRVLLEWYTIGKRFFRVSGNERLSVEGLLLYALKDVGDLGLRGRIEEALAPLPHGQYVEERGAEIRETEKEVHEVPGDLKDESPEDLRARGASTNELQKKIDELKRLRELASRAKGS